MKWQSIQKPKSIVHDKSVSNSTYGRFVIEPLEKGYGNTLGNSLRRVMLSSMQGAAITAFRVDGVLHEFTTIPGVVEDVTEIVLNLKMVRFRVHRDFPVPLYIDVDKKGSVTAGDIQGDPETTIINPNQVICTLAKKQRFRMEFEMGAGKGYNLSDENKKDTSPRGTIAIDSIFTPVQKVSYTVEPARVGQRTDFDKLIIEINTDGSISPEEAITMGSRILIEHLELFIIPEAELEQVQELKVDEGMMRVKNLLKMSVAELELSVRASNCLRAANIVIMADLVRKTEHEMLKYRNFGRKSLEELTHVLEDLNLFFGMEVGPYFTEDELNEIRRIAIEEAAIREAERAAMEEDMLDGEEDLDDEDDDDFIDEQTTEESEDVSEDFSANSKTYISDYNDIDQESDDHSAGYDDVYEDDDVVKKPKKREKTAVAVKKSLRKSARVKDAFEDEDDPIMIDDADDPDI